MKVLITGASGLLGRELMNIFSDEETIGLSHSREGDGLRPVDLRNEEAFRDILAEVQPELVIHAAAYRDPDYCEENREDAKKLNVDSVGILHDTLPEDTRIVFMSTDYLFDGENPPYTEESPREPLNYYGETKRMAEDILQQRSNSLAMRIPVLIGLDDTFEKSGFAYKLVQAARSRETTILDNFHVRYPTWTRDVARALRFAVEQNIEGVLHFSGLQGGTQYELAIETAKLLGESSKHIQPADTPPPRKAKRPRDSHLSPARIQALGFDRFTAFNDAMQAISNNFKIFCLAMIFYHL